MSAVEIQLVSAGLLAVMMVSFLMWKFYEPFRPGFVRANIAMPDRRIRRKFLKVKRTQAEADNQKVNIETIVDLGAEYHVVPEALFATGWQRTPTGYYAYGRFEPINLQTMKMESKLSGREYHDAIEAHVAADVINSLKPKNALSTAMSLFILGGVIMAGIGVLYFKTQDEVKTLRTEMYGMHNVPIPSESSPSTPANTGTTITPFGG